MSTTSVSIVVDDQTEFDLREPQVDMFTHSITIKGEFGAQTTLYFSGDSFAKLKEIINS